LQRRERELAKARGEQLERKRDLIEDDRRNRNHQDKKGDRKPENPQVLPAKHEQDDAGDHRKKCKPAEEQL